MKAKLLFFMFVILFTSAINAYAQGQPIFAIQPSIKPSVLPLNSNVSATICMSNEGTQNSVVVPVCALQTFNLDAAVGAITSVSPIYLDNPTAGVPVSNPINAQDFTLILNQVNPNKILVSFVGQVAKDFPARVHVCVDVNIHTSATPIKSSLRFYGISYHIHR